MSNHKQSHESFVPQIEESDEEKFARLLKEAGIMKKVVEEVFSPEERVEKIKGLLEVLKMAKESKDERLAKKIRRTLRKKYRFSIREHMKIEVI